VATRQTHCFYIDSVITVVGRTMGAIAAQKSVFSRVNPASIRIQCGGMEEDSASTLLLSTLFVIVLKPLVTATSK
jgi:hypothetical protein